MGFHLYTLTNKTTLLCLKLLYSVQYDEAYEYCNCTISTRNLKISFILFDSFASAINIFNKIRQLEIKLILPSFASDILNNSSMFSVIISIVNLTYPKNFMDKQMTVYK